MAQERIDKLSEMDHANSLLAVTIRDDPELLVQWTLRGDVVPSDFGVLGEIFRWDAARCLKAFLNERGIDIKDVGLAVVKAGALKCLKYYCSVEPPTAEMREKAKLRYEQAMECEEDWDDYDEMPWTIAWGKEIACHNYLQSVV